jgi:hypothetical protein
MIVRTWHVRLVPCVDGSELARFLTFTALVDAAECSAFRSKFANSQPGRRDSNLGISKSSKRRMWTVSWSPQAVQWQYCIIRDAVVRPLPPQAHSPSLTHTEYGRARNAAIWLRFADKHLVSVWGNLPHARMRRLLRIPRCSRFSRSFETQPSARYCSKIAPPHLH